MDNHIFRNSLSGFNRQDVTTYIEKTQKETAERLRNLEDEIDELYKSRGELERQLNNYEDEKEMFSRQMDEQVRLCEQIKGERDAECAEKERYQVILSERERELHAVMVERDELFTSVQNLEQQVAKAQREKFNVAQLELEARQRAQIVVEDANRQAEELLCRARAETEHTVAQARAEAERTLAQARAEAEHTVSNAKTTAEEIHTQVAGQVENTVHQYNELFSSFETIASHVSAELRKMDVVVAQLPINFNHLKDSLGAVLEQAKYPADTEEKNN